MLKKIINIRTILMLLIISGIGYLVSKFPDEGVLVLGIVAIIIIGVWLLQLNKENE